MNEPARRVFLDPPYKVYYQDRLFGDPSLNRDNCLAAYVRLRNRLQSRGGEVHTIDQLGAEDPGPVDYYSFGVLENYRSLAERPGVRLAAFVVLEPPVVVPEMYNCLPELTAAFDRVYVHNTHGSGYSLDGVDRSRLRKLYVPEPYEDVIERWWNVEDRQPRLVMINGNHRPVSRSGELYSRRIEAAVELSRCGAIDLYGQGWHRWWSRSSMWWPYWRSRRRLMSIYQGPCASKYEVLSRYRFSLCFENMAMDGYVTEKIFDCFYAGTIPLYLGGSDAGRYLPAEAYIDCAQFSNWKDLWNYVRSLTPRQVQLLKEAGRESVRQQGPRYYNSLLEVFEV